MPERPRLVSLLVAAGAPTAYSSSVLVPEAPVDLQLRMVVGNTGPAAVKVAGRKVSLLIRDVRRKITVSEKPIMAASATVDNHTGTSSDPVWSAAAVQPQTVLGGFERGSVTTSPSGGADPEARSADGASFSIAWRTRC